MSKKRKNVIALLAVLSVVFITAGVTYAFFSYSRSGNTENSISSGSITFHYTEGNRSIILNDALPMTDTQGMAQTNYFDFTVESNTSSTIEIPYYITVRRSTSSEATLDSHVKVYLTKVTGEGQNEQETPVALITNQTISKFSELGTYTNSSIQIPASEKALYTDTVPVNSSNYNVKYRLRMWIDQNTDFSAVTKYYCGTAEITQAQYENTEYTCESGEKNTQDTYPFNNKTYTLTVNVYGEGQVAGATPAIPTMAEMCPDCVYAFTTDIWYYSGTPATLTSTQYKANYQDVVSESGKNHFLGLKLNNSGTIEKAYACGIKDGTPFCIEGSTDGSTYAANNTLLNTLYGPLYGPYDSGAYLGCADGGSSVHCFGSVSAVARDDGNVNVNDDDGYCTVDYDGNAYCN